MALDDPGSSQNRKGYLGSSRGSGTHPGDHAPITNQQILDIMGFKIRIDDRRLRVYSGPTGAHLVFSPGLRSQFLKRRRRDFLRTHFFQNLPCLLNPFLDPLQGQGMVIPVNLKNKGIGS